MSSHILSIIKFKVPIHLQFAIENIEHVYTTWQSLYHSQYNL